MVPLADAVTRTMGNQKTKRDHEKYPTADAELTDAEITEQYGRLLAFHLEWIASAVDVDAAIEMVTFANGLSPKQRRKASVPTTDARSVPETHGDNSLPRDD